MTIGRKHTSHAAHLSAYAEIYSISGSYRAAASEAHMAEQYCSTEIEYDLCGGQYAC